MRLIGEHRGALQRVGVLGLFALSLGGLTEVHGQAPGWFVAVSKPPPPTVPSDPPQGLIFKAPLDMSASRRAFNLVMKPQSLEYLHFDAEGDAYITFDDGPVEAAPGGVMVIGSFLDRDGGFDPARDRLITGTATGLVEPKDIVVADELGVAIVADFAEAKLVAFDLQADGNSAPLFVTTDLGLTSTGEPRRPWGLAFDTVNDRLFVGGTDGAALVFDDYLVNQGENGPDRVITPAAKGKRISVNLHDAFYLADKDILIVSDIGRATTADEPNWDADGKVFVLENASTADGDTEVRLQLAGQNTMLGNPVGVASDGKDLFITERTKDVVLRFDNVLTLTGTLNIAPSGAVTVAQPEAVALVNENARKTE